MSSCKVEGIASAADSPLAKSATCEIWVRDAPAGRAASDRKVLGRFRWSKTLPRVAPLAIERCETLPRVAPLAIERCLVPIIPAHRLPTQQTPPMRRALKGWGGRAAACIDAQCNAPAGRAASDRKVRDAPAGRAASDRKVRDAPRVAPLAIERCETLPRVAPLAIERCLVDLGGEQDAPAGRAASDRKVRDAPAGRAASDRKVLGPDHPCSPPTNSADAANASPT